MSGLDIVEISELGGAPNVITLNQDKSSSGGDDASSIGAMASGGGKSVNFGSGIELLMNDKRKTGSDSKKGDEDDIALGDINQLEAELNDLADGSSDKKESKKSMFSSVLGGGGGGPIKLNVDDVSTEVQTRDLLRLLESKLLQLRHRMVLESSITSLLILISRLQPSLSFLLRRHSRKSSRFYVN